MFSCCACKNSKKEKSKNGSDEEDSGDEESNDNSSVNDVEPIKIQIQSPLKNVKADDSAGDNNINNIEVIEASTVVNGSLKDTEANFEAGSNGKLIINGEDMKEEVGKADGIEGDLSSEQVAVVMAERISGDVVVLEKEGGGEENGKLDEGTGKLQVDEEMNEKIAQSEEKLSVDGKQLEDNGTIAKNFCAEAVAAVEKPENEKTDDEKIAEKCKKTENEWESVKVVIEKYESLENTGDVDENVVKIDENATGNEQENGEKISINEKQAPTIKIEKPAEDDEENEEKQIIEPKNDTKNTENQPNLLENETCPEKTSEAEFIVTEEPEKIPETMEDNKNVENVGLDAEKNDKAGKLTIIDDAKAEESAEMSSIKSQNNESSLKFMENVGLNEINKENVEDNCGESDQRKNLDSGDVEIMLNVNEGLEMNNYQEDLVKGEVNNVEVSDGGKNINELEQNRENFEEDQDKKYPTSDDYPDLDEHVSKVINSANESEITSVKLKNSLETEIDGKEAFPEVESCKFDEQIYLEAVEANLVAQLVNIGKDDIVESETGLLDEKSDEESSPSQTSVKTIENVSIFPLSLNKLENSNLGPPKVPLFDAPAYIERRIVDPDDEDDDSVFEKSSHVITASPSFSENNQDNADEEDVVSNNQVVNHDAMGVHDLDGNRVIDTDIDQTSFVDVNQFVNEDGMSESDDFPPPPPPPMILEARPDRPLCRWLSEEDDDNLDGGNGMQEPPATPVAKDELALRRHRFFSDLLHAAKNSTEHRVRFDPLGPMIHPGSDNDREEQLEQLVTRLENVTKRLECVPTKLFAETQEVAVQTLISSSKESDDQIKGVTINQTQRDNFLSEYTINISETPIVQVIKEVDINADFSTIQSNMSVAGYEDIIAGPVADYLQLSEKIGGDVAGHSKLVEKVFQIQRDFIRTAASRAAPLNQSEQVSLLGPTSSQIQLIQDFREKNRGSPFFNHLSAISESIPALGWVAVSPTPAPYVKEMNDAGQFYTNRVLKDWKEKDKKHVDWCKAWVQTLAELQKYVRQHHTTGLVWAKTGSAPVPPPPGGMPPPPPCMPVDFGNAPADGDDRSALFAQINQGENITKSLKKVTSDMQTHKNPSLRTGPAPFKAPVVSNSRSTPMKSVPANAPIDKPPVFNRDGKKWLVEYQKGNHDLLVENAEMNNVLYMYHCQDCTLVVKGKINTIVMDSCRKSSIVFDALVSSMEFVDCQSVQMQVLGKVPTISIDKTDGCQIYLSPESLDVELITSKSTEMNVMVPKSNGDYTEFPVPEQFKTTVSVNGLSTTAIDEQKLYVFSV